MKQYHEALKTILENGVNKTDRTGVGTRSVFGMQMRFDLRTGFPAVTTKKLAWRAVVSELLWFLEGSNDERRLAEILHGTRDSNKKTIWTDNANAEYWKSKAMFPGDLGKVYGVQWRSWPSYKWNDRANAHEYKPIDQIQQLIDGIKQDPDSRRHILSAWNPAELDQMALPPCHVLSQFDVTNGHLSCHLYQRSADAPLGVPFNIASYSLLTHMIAQVCDLKVGEFIHTIGDLHIYLNQIDGVKEQLTREPLLLSKLWINPDIKDINCFTMNDIKLIDYQSHPSITFPFST